MTMVVVTRKRRMNRFRRVREQWLWSGSAVALLLWLWEAASRLGWLSPDYVSSPSRVVLAGRDFLQTGEIWHHLGISGLEFALGFFAALLFGVAGGLTLGYYRTLRLIFDPLIMGLNATPRLALLPVIVVWLGIGVVSKSAMVFLGAVVPIAVNTMAGLQSVDPLLIRVARSFGARERTIFLKILLPASLSSVLAGIRLGLGRGLISVVVAEMFNSLEGVGYLIIQAGSGFQMDRLFFLVFLIAILGYAMIALVQFLEKRLAEWKE